MAASVVLPSPGGPASRRWSAAWPRRRAASRMTDRCSFTSAWPTNSSSRWGRRPASTLSSSGPAAGSRNSSRTAHRQHLEGVAQEDGGVGAVVQLAQGVADLLGGVAEAGEGFGHRLGGGGAAVAVGGGDEAIEAGAVEAALEFEEEAGRRLLAHARHEGEGGDVVVGHDAAQLGGAM